MDKKILDNVRTYGLWAVLGAAALLLVMSVLEVWELVPTEEMYGDWEVTAEWWSRIEGTLLLIVVLGGVVLLSLLVASRVKSEDEAPAKVKSAPAAKKPAAKKAAPKKK